MPSSQINSSECHSIKGRTRLGAIPSAYSLHYRLVYNAIGSHWSVSQTSLFWLFWKSSRATFSFIQILLPFMELVSAAFAPYRVRPFEFAPTLYRVRPHTFRVRPHQVEFAPWLSDIQMSWFVSWWVNSSVLIS